MNLAYTMDFIQYYFQILGKHKSNEDAYWAAEAAYRKQHSYAKRNKYNTYDSFRNSLSYHLRANKHKL